MSLTTDLVELKNQLTQIQVLGNAIQASIDFYVAAKGAEPTPSTAITTPRNAILSSLSDVRDNLALCGKRIMDGIDTGMP